MRLPPEWPWRARKNKVIPEKSVQYWYLFLFPPPPAMLFSPTCRQTNEDDTGNVSEDNLLISRIQLLHHHLDVLVFHDAKDGSISSTHHNRRVNNSPGSSSVQVLSPTRIVLGEEPASSLLCGFALAFDRLSKSFVSNFNAYSSSWTSRMSCSLLFKFITNLFNPWEILTQEWVLSLFRDQIPISTPYLLSAEAILASSTSKFGIEIPRVDDEDLNSSTESANSTSLIHCITSVRNCEQVHTSVLNRIFQKAKVAGVRNLSKWRSEICGRCWSAP